MKQKQSDIIERAKEIMKLIGLKYDKNKDVTPIFEGKGGKIEATNKFISAKTL